MFLQIMITSYISSDANTRNRLCVDEAVRAHLELPLILQSNLLTVDSGHRRSKLLPWAALGSCMNITARISTGFLLFVTWLDPLLHCKGDNSVWVTGTYIMSTVHGMSTLHILGCAHFTFADCDSPDVKLLLHNACIFVLEFNECNLDKTICSLVHWKQQKISMRLLCLIFLQLHHYFHYPH